MARIRELLDLSDDADRSCAGIDALARSHLGEVERKIASLDSLRTKLGRMIAACEEEIVGDCRIIDVLAGTTEP